ncbi:MAG: DUF2017 domain-containing protein [Pseudolysinimonas sp.]
MPFTSTKKGVTARFAEGEAELLRDLAGQLVEMLEGRSAEAGDSGDVLLAQLGIGGGTTAPLDPAVARLLPDAYRGDDAAASEHRHLTERGLIDRKVANARAVIASLASGTITLDQSEVQSWLRTLTDLRLTIAARLEIEQDGDEGRLETDSDFALQAAYDWLGYLQGTLVDAIDR